MQVEGDFAGNGYAVLRGLVAPEIAERLLKRLWTDLREKQVTTFAPTEDMVGHLGIDVHGGDYLPFSDFHWGMTPAIEQAAGAELLPSYCHYRMYMKGARCRVHSDRPGSEVALSLTLGYSDGLPWSLIVGSIPGATPSPKSDDFGKEPSATVELMPGDALLYRGVELRHGRLDPNPNRWSAHLFMMWVKRGGAQEAEAFQVRSAAE